jgi:hypothetical protein
VRNSFIEAARPSSYAGVDGQAISLPNTIMLLEQAFNAPIRDVLFICKAH